MSTTVQEIIYWADRKYPNQETDANKIIDLDVIYKNLFNAMQRLTDAYQIYETYTVSGQLTYSLPTRCRIYNIESMQVSKVTSSNVTATSEWDNADYAGLSTVIDTGTYYGRISDDVFALSRNGLAYTTTDLVIKIFYYRTPEELTAVTDIPELDDRYTPLLKYALVGSIASQGANPDTEIADYYQAKYDEEIESCIGDLNNRFNNAPNEDTRPDEWW